MALRSLHPTVYTLQLGPLKLWRDDVAEMAKIVMEAFPSDPITYGAPGYTFDDIDDLSQVPGRQIDKVEILCDSRNFALVLARGNSYISATEPNLHLRGAMNEISLVAKRCGRSFFHRVSYKLLKRGGSSSDFFDGFTALLALAGTGTAAITTFLTSNDAFRNNHWDGKAWGTAAAIAALLVLSLFAGVRGGKTIIYTKTRIEAPGFFARKRDDLAITIVSNIIALIVGGFIGYWINTIS